ncbi:helix-turn-helix domain-containing protein [Aquimarina sp. M1]
MSRLLEYREKLNLTQKELSKESGISVRTIQRIESGTKPKGYTLKTLAKTLGVNEIDLLKNDTPTKKSNYNLTNLINLSSLIVVFIPVVSFIIPFSITLIKKQWNDVTKQIINIQILWSVTMILTFLISSVINSYFPFINNSLIVILLVLILANALIIIRNSIELDKNDKLYFHLKFSIV